MVTPIAYYLEESRVKTNKRRVTFLDTGEHYIISFESKQDPAKLADIVARLYECLGISVTFDPTDIFVTDGQSELIIDTMGRVFSENSVGVRCDLSKLKNDIAKIVDFYDIRKKVTYEAPRGAPWRGPKSVFDYVPQPDYKELPKPQDTRRDPKPANDSDYEDKGCFDLDMSDDSMVTMLPKKHLIHILYNSLFSMSIVFEDVVTEKCAEELCKQYPDFELVRTFPQPSEDIRNLCSSLFHRKTIERADLDAKGESFIKLFELEPPVKGSDIYNGIAFTALGHLKQILETHFVVNDDPNTTMRAHKVIDEVSRKLESGLIADPRFNPINSRRIPGLLLECGLKKKRLRDGNHYYGIRLKTKADYPSIDRRLKDLEKQRNKDVYVNREVEKVLDSGIDSRAYQLREQREIDLKLARDIKTELKAII